MPRRQGDKTLPKRKLGKTGLEITMLEMGTGALREQGVLERLIRLSYASGVRTFDTAKAVWHRARLQEMVRADSRGSQGDRPGHQGQSARTQRDAGNARQAAGGLVDRLCRPLLHPRPGR